jgi:hypothetical protein
MVVVDVAVKKDAKELHEGNLASVSSMVAVRGAKSQTVQRVQKDGQACALLTEVGADVSILVAARGLRAVLISAKPTVVERGAHTLIVPREQKEVHHSARAMEVANAVQLKVAPRVCMVEPNSVLRMEVGSGVL